MEQEITEDEMGAPEPTSKKRGGMLVWLPYVFMAILLVLTALSYIATDSANIKTSNNLSKTFGTVTKNASSVEEIKGKFKQLTDELPSTIESLVSDVIETKGQQQESAINKAVKAEVEKYITQLTRTNDNTNDGLSRVEIEGIVKTLLLTEKSQRERQIQQLTRKQGELTQLYKTQTRQLESHRNNVNALARQLEDIKTNGTEVKVTATTKSRKRLKEFNLIMPPLKGGTVFGVDAPLKNGADNVITLTKGERFFSKFGSHTVEAIQHVDGKYKMIVSGGYFIDVNRDEITKQELLAIAANKKRVANQKKKQDELKITKRATDHKEKTQTYVQSKKFILKDWFVITRLPEKQQVMVYRKDLQEPLTLTLNQNVKGVGTVRTIDFTTGETCFEKSCIAGMPLNRE